jgi:signal transduction histidine kinase/ligand-binding sensor domain-containing protein/DNA-binding response OmpR family regulator
MCFALKIEYCKTFSRRTCCLLIASFLAFSPIFSQNKKPIFQSLQQGLSNQTIQCILKDSKGFMWFGTNDGLNKFDGANMVIYENSPDDTSSISHNSINSIVEDKDHNLWVGTSDGLNLFNRDLDNFVRIRFPGIERMYISSLSTDNNGNIWIGTFGIGIIRYNYKNFSSHYFLHNDNDINSISSNFVTGIVSDKRQNIWIGTWKGLDFLNHDHTVFKHFKHAVDKTSLSNNLISTVRLDAEGNLWIGTSGGGLNKLWKDRGAIVFQHFQHSDAPHSLSNNNILSICEDNIGNFWIGTDNGGLNYLNTKTGSFTSYHPEDDNHGSISSNGIPSLYLDNDNILWIGTYNQGLNFIDEKFEKFERFQKNSLSKNSIQDNDVTGFAEDNDGNIWIATDGGGISRFDTKSGIITQIAKHDPHGHPINNNVQSIVYDKNNNIWLATWNGGIDRLNKSGYIVKKYKVEGSLKAGDNRIMALYEDKQQNIWAGTAGSGLFLYNPQEDKFIQITDHSRSSGNTDIAYVTSIFEDHNNIIWVGTLNGLLSLKKSGDNEFLFSWFFADRSANSISSRRITVIFEDRKKNLWFGTEDKGLNLFNKDNSFINFSKQDGLPSNSIKGILEDKKGHLWISTNKGLSEFDPDSKKFKNYTKEDGLNSDEFYRNSCFKSGYGELFFGGNNGFNAFYPDSIKSNALIPPVYLTDFKIFNKSVPIGTKGSPLRKHISQSKKIVLSYKQNSFSIEFVALNYTRSSQNQYAYMLEGLEKEWNRVEHKRFATYTYVSPGTYLFKVIGSNNDGIWNPIPATLQITILPPFWRTIWAYMIYVLVLFTLLFTFIRLMVIRAKQSQILELDRMKLNFFTNISHELRTPLTLILSPLENLISSTKIENEIKGQLSVIYRNAGRLFRLVNELMDFSKTEDSTLQILAQRGDIIKFTKEIVEFYNDEASRRRIDYQYIASEDSLKVWFDRDKLEKVILNLLSNAFKFTSDEGRITVSIEKTGSENTDGQNQFAKISVTDNGKGISQKYIDKVFDRFFQSPEENGISQKGTGIGLALAKNLVELHHGKIEVASEKFKETTFSVFLPLGNKCFAKNELIDAPIDINTSFVAAEIGKPIQIPPKGAYNILIVEDNFDLREYLASYLSAKYVIFECENGEQGYRLAIKEVPDLIISDIMMPKISGIELCKKIKEDIITSHIPVILLTAKITLEEKIEGVQTGADAYITKPFNIRFLEVTIKNLIETRHKLYKRFSQEVFIMPKELSNNTIDQDFLERAIEYIENNILNENLTARDLASYLLLSHSQTYRKIKALTGQSVSEFIRTIRLKKAIKLLETGEYNISEISYKIGFTSPAYFTKCFREHFGKPPSEFLSDFTNKKNAN